MIDDRPITGRVDAVTIFPLPGQVYVAVQLEAWDFPQNIETLDYRFDGEQMDGAGVVAKLAAWMAPGGHTPGARVWARFTPDPGSYVPWKSAEFFSERLP